MPLVGEASPARALQPQATADASFHGAAKKGASDGGDLFQVERLGAALGIYICFFKRGENLVAGAIHAVRERSQKHFSALAKCGAADGEEGFGRGYIHRRRGVWREVQDR